MNLGGIDTAVFTATEGAGPRGAPPPLRKAQRDALCLRFAGLTALMKSPALKASLPSCLWPSAALAAAAAADMAAPAPDSAVLPLALRFVRNLGGMLIRSERGECSGGALRRQGTAKVAAKQSRSGSSLFGSTQTLCTHSSATGAPPGAGRLLQASPARPRQQG